MYDTDDNIVALATLAGKSALNIVRVSGSSSLNIYQKLTNTKKKPRANYCIPKSIYASKNGRLIDHAMIIFYRGPRSFTGEDGIEIIVHGGVIIVDRIIDTIIGLGARHASPGEFSYRAYLNNKIDLIQAEAISSIVSATNNIDSFYYLNSIKGNLSEKISEHNDNLNEIITVGEHELNFSDSELKKTSIKQFRAKTKNIISLIQDLVDKSYTTEKSVSLIRVAIIGRPNVGKSSLFNILVGKSRSIVTSQKGTTRDTIESDVYVDDTLIRLVDTAGLRTAKNEAEIIGIKKSYKEIEESEIAMIVDDDNPKKIKDSLEIKNNQKIILINNKSDLKNKSETQYQGINISCKTEEGIDILSTKLSTLIKETETNFLSSYLYLINKRQLNLLESVKKGLDRALKVYEETQDLTIFISYLYVAQKNFDALVRPNDKNDIINNIFKGFCIGK